MTRESKLQKLHDKEAAKGMLVIANGGEPFIKALEAKIHQLKEVLDVGTEVDVSELSEQLKKIDEFVPAVKELVDAINALELPSIPEFPEIPSKLEVGNIKDLVDTVTELKGAIEKIEMPSLGGKLHALTDQISKQSNIYSEYKVADSDTTSDSASYYGFLNRSGGWYIMRQVDMRGVSNYRFASGKGGYRQSWVSRSSQEYVLYSEAGL